jgi:hypothetical protein
LCLDPHALAKIQTREALDNLEQILVAMAATNTGLSSLGLAQVARLRHRLAWCDECYSRQRSQALLSWVLRLAFELMIRVIGPSICFTHVARHLAARRLRHIRTDQLWETHDHRTHHTSSSTSRWIQPEKVCRRTLDYSFLSFTHRIRQTRSTHFAPPPDGASSWEPCNSAFRRIPGERTKSGRQSRRSTHYRTAYRGSQVKSSSRASCPCLH